MIKRKRKRSHFLNPFLTIHSERLVKRGGLKNLVIIRNVYTIMIPRKDVYSLFSIMYMG